ncbi:MAG: hypothetical protein HYY57_02770, partial [Candidatus Omnitrophica bacterium]|nr:hypothetical protein [Candidatus Omnitrophota bacterium]
NRHDSDDAEVLGLQIQRPYTIANSAAFGSPTIGPGEASPSVQVQFAPTAAGAFPEEVRMFTRGVKAAALDLRGEGVWQLFMGTFILENVPTTTLGSFTLGSSPIQSNQPIDWGLRQLGWPATEAEFRVRNSGAAVNGTASVRLLKGNQHFEITFPSTFAAMDIAQNGTRVIRVLFTPAELGDWQDVVEVIDTANTANRAGIVLKAKVVAVEEDGH